MKGKAEVSAKAAAPPKKKAAKSATAPTGAFPLKRELEAVRLIILGVSPKIEEGVKWNAPSFHVEGNWFATVNLRSTKALQIVLHLGAKTKPDLKAFKVADPNGLMEWRGKDRALVTLGLKSDIPANRKALEAIVRAWIKQL